MRKSGLVAMFTTFALLMLVGGWRVGALHSSKPARIDLFAEDMNAQIRRGIGSQVRFASPGSSTEEVRASVQSAANFIYARSGFRMSSETADRLVDLEEQTVNGKRQTITADVLIDVTADLASESLAELSDQDIDTAANSQRGSSFYTTEQLRAAVDGQRKGDQSVRDKIRFVIQQRVNDRLAVLGRALPKQFGRGTEEGITPVQALLVEYSIASDDLMARSVGELIGKSMKAVSTDRLNEHPERPFGVNGRFAATRLDLILNQKKSSIFLDRLDKEGQR